MIKQTAFFKPYIGEEQKIKDGLVAIDNMNENDPYAMLEFGISLAGTKLMPKLTEIRRNNEYLK